LLGSQHSSRRRHVAKIVKGASPAELPVGLEMLENLKTSRALNLELSLSLLAVADEMIE
jgi:hypothetical protein